MFALRGWLAEVEASDRAMKPMKMISPSEPELVKRQGKMALLALLLFAIMSSTALLFDYDAVKSQQDSKAQQLTLLLVTTPASCTILATNQAKQQRSVGWSSSTAA